MSAEIKRGKCKYSITLMWGAERVLFLEYVRSDKVVARWCKMKGIRWSHGTLWDRNTKAVVRRFKVSDF